ncbi:YkgJ family cysteine cluster protein [Clostridium sp. Marseille-P299]|uniref:YkgJ family cysteine cluster protein n=1 Tax=Clostridium sp. Marseille-P299 TaxID=1805477 RepID=UPI00082A92C4|nr:YkgJ family cysteine cluster protein [Clostridium sp. Marseille-P299]
MKRYCSLSEISDGNLYNINDLVQVSCNGCGGNANCCHGMGNSIVLDPYDIYRLVTNLNMTFEQLLIDKVELNIVDGLILPNLKMNEISEQCAFLNENGRCSIHSVRPGICRIFPLGRYYENNSFQYILQVNECPNESRTKVKVSKWIDTPDIMENQQFINDWHYFLKDIETMIKNTQDEKLIKNINMYILNSFYLKQYDTNIEFYEQFYERLNEAKKLFSQL